MKKIEIPYQGYDEILDLVQDKDGILYMASIHGVKIFDGSHWDFVKVDANRGIRKLFYDGNKRIYFAGWNNIGYIEKNKFNAFNVHYFTNDDFKNDFQSIWDIESCDGSIYFRSVNYLQSYNQLTNKTKQWYFKSKIGALLCYKNEIIAQDRGSGLVKLNKHNQWVPSTIKLLNNKLILELEKNENNIFVLTGTPIEQFIKNGKARVFDYIKPTYQKYNYSTVLALSPNIYVLGTTNGELSFFDLEKQEIESFNISNAWILKIIKTHNNDLIILADYDLYIISWPNFVRIQNEYDGLPRNVKMISQWNNVQYVLSSNGVFAQEQVDGKALENYSKLNWTSSEAWSFLPLSKNLALFLESYFLKLIDLTKNTATAITTDIFPREIFPSEFKANSYFIQTEFDVQLLVQQDDQWQLKIIYPHRISSLVELNSKSLLLNSKEKGLIQLDFNAIDNSYSSNNVEQKYAIAKQERGQLALFKTSQNEIYATGISHFYRLDKHKFIEDDIQGLATTFDVEDLQLLKQNKQGMLYAWNSKDFFYQNSSSKWQKINTNRFARGNIMDANYSNDEINILKNSNIISFSSQNPVSKKRPTYSLVLKKVSLKSNSKSSQLPIKPKTEINIEQKIDEIKFSYVLTELTEKPRYRYRLIGDDDQWSELSLIGEISFHNLSAKSYTFEFQALSSNGTVYSSLPYHFTIQPYWYLTNFMKFMWLVLFISLFSLIVFIIIKWRERKFELHELELKNIINSKTSELKKLNKNLQKMALKDGLTGLSNRNYLEDYINKIAEQEIHSLTVIMFDMDHFKKYNDKNGHLAGDELLKSLANILLQEIETNQAIIARYGGEEFITIIQDMSLNETVEIAENIRKRVEDKQAKVSISIGISSSSSPPTHSEEVYELIDLADKALYRSKNLGRNMVSIHE